MCLVHPIAPPCCRRTYVLVSRLPGCNSDWPKRKCDFDFCIQLGQYKPEYTDSGECWRCEAERAGEVGMEREKRRPGIDRAVITFGQDLTTLEKKTFMEDQGFCWYCEARVGCRACGSGMPLNGKPTEEVRADVCWFCHASKLCNFCLPTPTPAPIVKKERSPSFTKSRKRSRPESASGTRRGGKSKKMKAESPVQRVSAPAYAPPGYTATHPQSRNTHQSYGIEYQPSRACPPGSDPRGFTSGPDLGLQFDGVCEDLKYHPDTLATYPNSWQAVNQQNSIDWGANTHQNGFTGDYNQNSLQSFTGHGAGASQLTGYDPQLYSTQQSQGYGVNDQADNSLDLVSKFLIFSR